MGLTVGTKLLDLRSEKLASFNRVNTTMISGHNL